MKRFLKRLGRQVLKHRKSTMQGLMVAGLSAVPVVGGLLGGALPAILDNPTAQGLAHVGVGVGLKLVAGTDHDQAEKE